MTEPEPIERRKPDDERKEAHLRVRVAAANMEEFKAAAKKSGINLSAWVVDRLVRIARQENKES